MEATDNHITEAINRTEKLRAENERISAKAKAELDRARKLVADVTEFIQWSKNSN